MLVAGGDPQRFNNARPVLTTTALAVFLKTHAWATRGWFLGWGLSGRTLGDAASARGGARGAAGLIGMHEAGPWANFLTRTKSEDALSSPGVSTPIAGYSWMADWALERRPGPTIKACDRTYRRNGIRFAFGCCQRAVGRLLRLRQRIANKLMMDHTRRERVSGNCGLDPPLLLSIRRNCFLGSRAGFCLDAKRAFRANQTHMVSSEPE
jgi:hypothetical protein